MSIQSPSSQISLSLLLDQITDKELVETVEKMESDIIYFELENEMFENFLKQTDPQLIADMEQVLDLARQLHQQKGLAQTPSPIPILKRGEESSLVPSSRRSGSVVRFSSTLRIPSAPTTIADKGPKVNFAQRTELVFRELEEMQTSFQQFQKRSATQKNHLNAEIEEMNIRSGEIEDGSKVFEENIIIGGVDALTQRIPAEKFVRYMEEWLRSADSTLGKMRLRTSTLRALYHKMRGQLQAKMELGESLHAVDFEQLEIENKHLKEAIEQKNSHLLELKRMNGTANFVLNNHKQYLHKQVQELNKIKKAIKETEEKVVAMDNESDMVEKSAKQAQQKSEAIDTLIKSYTVPETMQYMKINDALKELKKSCKNWARRNNILEFALNDCIRQMKTLTGEKITNPKWLEYQTQQKYSDEWNWDGLQSSSKVIINPSDQHL